MQQEFGNHLRRNLKGSEKKLAKASLLQKIQKKILLAVYYRRKGIRRQIENKYRLDDFLGISPKYSIQKV